MSKALVFLNGQIIPADQAKVSIMDRGFHYGDGVFETIRTKAGVPHALPEHYARLQQGADVLGVKVPYTLVQIQNAIQQLIEKNQLKDALVKIMLTRGPAKRIGLSPKLATGKSTCCIFTWVVDPPYQNKRSYDVVMASAPRNRTPITGLKSLNYLSHVMAKAEADRAGADEAIFVDSNGHVLEGTISNIFIIQRGGLFTPPLHVGILDGITRREVLQIARRLKIPIFERTFTAHDFSHADEAFLAFTSAGVMPIRMVNQQKIGPRCPGPVTQKLRTAFENLKG